MVKVMTEAAFNEAMENVKNQVIADLAENLKEQLTQKLGKYTTLNMNDGVVAVAIDDEGLVSDILEGLFEFEEDEDDEEIDGIENITVKVEIG